MFDLSREKLENLYNDKKPTTPYKVREIIMDNERDYSVVKQLYWLKKNYRSQRSTRETKILMTFFSKNSAKKIPGNF